MRCAIRRRRIAYFLVALAQKRGPKSSPLYGTRGSGDRFWTTLVLLICVAGNRARNGRQSSSTSYPASIAIERLPERALSWSSPLATHLRKVKRRVREFGADAFTFHSSSDRKRFSHALPPRPRNRLAQRVELTRAQTAVPLSLIGLNLVLGIGAAHVLLRPIAVCPTTRMQTVPEPLDRLVSLNDCRVRSGRRRRGPSALHS